MNTSTRVALGWFLAAWFGLLALAVAAVFAWVQPHTKTVHAPAEPLGPQPSSSKVQAVLGVAPQQMPGAEVNPQLEGAVCEVYPLADGIALVCHPPG